MTITEKIQAVAVKGNIEDCESLQWAIECAGLGPVKMHEIANAMITLQGPTVTGTWCLKFGREEAAC